MHRDHDAYCQWLREHWFIWQARQELPPGARWDWERPSGGLPPWQSGGCVRYLEVLDSELGGDAHGTT